MPIQSKYAKAPTATKKNRKRAGSDSTQKTKHKKKRQRSPTPTSEAEVPNKAPDVEEISDTEEPEEDAEVELGDPLHLSTKVRADTRAARLSKKWKSPIYAFYEPIPEVDHENGRRCHVFKCSSPSCKYKCRQYLDKGDSNSTSNLRKHVKVCWGEDVMKAAEEARDVDVAREQIVGSVIRTGSITMAFKRKGKGKVTYSNRQHTKSETR
jgi:hypothetical protein